MKISRNKKSLNFKGVSIFSKNERELKTAENYRNYQANLIFNQVHIHLHYILEFAKHLAQCSNVSICQMFQIIWIKYLFIEQYSLQIYKYILFLIAILLLLSAYIMTTDSYM